MSSTSDLLNTAKSQEAEPALALDYDTAINEAWVKLWLCRKMKESNGLDIKLKDGHIQLGYIGREIPTSEGTTESERLDILGYNQESKALVAFEIKGPDASRVDQENLFLQGLDHREWLEANKMAVKFVFDGPRGTRINTTKRVRLILGFFEERFYHGRIPEVYWNLKEQAQRRDRKLDIDFIHFTQSGGINGTLELTHRDRP
jgi:hypothetical protein